MRTVHSLTVKTPGIFAPRKPTPIVYAVTLFIALGVQPTHAPAALWDLATAPLQTSGAANVKPNIFFILDNSGSMDWDYMPDWVRADFRNDEPLWRNSEVNGAYYNPRITYTPPKKYDGSDYASMTAGNTQSWKQVPYDGFNVQTKDGNNLNNFPASGTTNDLTGAKYYTFTPGEYCTTPNLRTCTPQAAPSATHPYPALVRWCSDTALTQCQANRTGSFTKIKYPGQGAVAATSATSSLVIDNVSRNITDIITSITAGGNEILSASLTSSNNSNNNSSNNWARDRDLAQKIINGINACETIKIGNCTVTGYTASLGSNGWTVIITAPESIGNSLNSIKPVVVYSSSRVTLTINSFSGGATANPAVGSNNLTTIASGNNSYPKATTRSDCTGATCTYDEEMTNFANWWAYYHTRLQMAKSSVLTAFQTLDDRFRLGYLSLNNYNKDKKSSDSFQNIDDLEKAPTASGQKAQWFTKVANAIPNNGTPLRHALSVAGRIYAGKITGSTTTSTLWQYGESTTPVNITDPMKFSCQRNFTLLSTDGYWNGWAGKKLDGSTNIGDEDSNETGAAKDGIPVSGTLADVAQYYYHEDLRTSANDPASDNNVPDGQQRMYTSTLGLGVSGNMLYQSNYATAKSGDFFDVKSGTQVTSSNCAWQTSGSCTWPEPKADTLSAIDDLWHAAVNGRGVYYSAKDPASLKSSLEDFLNNVGATTSSSAAATTSNPNVSAGDNYLFKSTFKSAAWYGELARYTLDLTTGAISQNADWSQSGTAFANATTKTYTPPLLDNRSHTTRKIYTYDAASSSLIDFDWSSLTGAGLDRYFKQAHIASTSAPLQPLSQWCSSGTTCLDAAALGDSTTAGTTTGAGGINLVNFLRGDRSNEGPDATTYYFAREHVLGDIVDSQAVYVKAPLWSYNDTGYAAFKADKANRQGMVYVGANDGMLHAFNADDGKEEWAYIPSMLLPNLYKLADKKYAAKHNYYVNATPKSGDVYISSGGTGAWKTILVGGLGQGGRGYYALDITDPASPSVLWEFDYTTDSDLGYTYGTPIITKLADGTWVVIVTSGYNNVSPGSGKGIVYVLDAKTGSVLHKIDNGMGSTTTPSGLSKLSAFVESSRSNNLSLRVYGGDLYGNVWRFDLSQLKGDKTGSAYVQRLATLAADSNGTTPQPITTRPEVSYINNRVVVYVGTGAYLGAADVQNTDTQTIYALKDPVALNASTAASSKTTATYSNPRTNTCTATTTTACFIKNTLVNVTGNKRKIDSNATGAVNYDADFATMNGWYADMPSAGERIDTDPDLQLGTLAFTSNKPATNDPCSAGGSSHLNYLDYKTGKTVPGASDVGVSLSKGSTSALSTAVTLVRLPNGKVVGVTNLSDGSSTTVETPVRSSGTGTRRVTWRELMN
jgi:type IV pilus assembly protein PilY1